MGWERKETHTDPDYPKGCKALRIHGLGTAGLQNYKQHLQHFHFLVYEVIQRESIVIVKKFEPEILTNLHVLDLPESEKHDFGIMSVTTIPRKLLELRG
ncbi:hypothetical protein AVEN_44809-1 [Araneus ventricosus]|uniref:Uncharacterized protein n=1 Tax=Araneus ventricosus TaxID=182803 RepID=A0A4Y2P172_ARAVE|nr:hypothetical protein AVEN_44809-1 [Araneus ventricosus]